MTVAIAIGFAWDSSGHEKKSTRLWHWIRIVGLWTRLMDDRRVVMVVMVVLAVAGVCSGSQLIGRPDQIRSDQIESSRVELYEILCRIVRNRGESNRIESNRMRMRMPLIVSSWPLAHGNQRASREGIRASKVSIEARSGNDMLQ